MHATIFLHQDYRSFLIAEFDNRRTRNPAYSLRAFARDLRIAPSTLSGLLNRRHGLSPGRATRIAQSIGMSSEEQTFFCRLVEAEEGGTDRRKQKAQDELATIKSMWKGEARKLTVYLSIPPHRQNVVTARVSAFRRELEALATNIGEAERPEDLMQYAVEFVCQTTPRWAQAQSG